MIDKVARILTFMDKSHEPSEGYSSITVKSWMVEYTVTVDDEENRHLSLILADDMGDIHETPLSRPKLNRDCLERTSTGSKPRNS